MAPVPPTKSPSAGTLRRQRISGQIHPLLPSKVFRPGAAVSDSFLSSKRDKRRIRQSVFLSRVQASSSSAGVSKSKHRRNRRPANKLASLDDLASALPEDDSAEGAVPRDGKIRHKSLKSRKGALKRKETVVRGEMDRFGASMARLSEVSEARKAMTAADAQSISTTPGGPDGQDATTTDNAPPATANRWAALRGYISATMEQNPAFAGPS